MDTCLQAPASSDPGARAMGPSSRNPAFSDTASPFMQSAAAHAFRLEVIKQQVCAEENQRLHQFARQHLNQQPLQQTLHQQKHQHPQQRQPELAQQRQHPQPAAGAAGSSDYNTGAGEQATAALPDGAEQSRAVVVAWLAQVVSLLGLSPATLAATIGLLDSFMKRQAAPPPAKMLQLLALSCLSLAARQEEAGRGTKSAALLECASLAVDPATGAPLYTADDFKRMQWLVLETLDYRTLRPSAYSFLQRLLHCLEPDPRVTDGINTEGGGSNNGSGVASSGSGGGGVWSVFQSLFADANAVHRVMACALFLTELSLPCGPLQSFPPSTQAAACFVLATQLINRTSGPSRPHAASGSTAGAPPAPMPPAPAPPPAAADINTALDVDMERTEEWPVPPSPWQGAELMDTLEGDDAAAPASGAAMAAPPWDGSGSSIAGVGSSGGGGVGGSSSSLSFVLAPRVPLSARARSYSLSSDGSGSNTSGSDLHRNHRSNSTDNNSSNSSGGAATATATGIGCSEAAVGGAAAPFRLPALVSKLAAAFDVDEQQLAPGYNDCAQLLRSLCLCAVQWYVTNRDGARGEEPASPLQVWLAPELLTRHMDVLSELASSLLMIVSPCS